MPGASLSLHVISASSFSYATDNTVDCGVKYIYIDISRGLSRWSDYKSYTCVQGMRETSKKNSSWLVCVAFHSPYHRAKTRNTILPRSTLRQPNFRNGTPHRTEELTRTQEWCVNIFYICTCFLSRGVYYTRVRFDVFFMRGSVALDGVVDHILCVLQVWFGFRLRVSSDELKMCDQDKRCARGTTRENYLKM